MGEDGAFIKQLNILALGDAWVKKCRRIGRGWGKAAAHLVYVARYFVQNGGRYPKDVNLYIYGSANKGKSSYFLSYLFAVGLLGYKLRHSPKFDNTWVDGLFDFVYADDWDCYKTVAWVNSF